MPTISRAPDERYPVYAFSGEPEIPVEYLWDSRYHNVTEANRVLTPGTVIRCWDGSVFRYVLAFGGALALGEIMRPEIAAMKTYAAETAVAYDALNLTLTFPNVSTTAALLKQIIGQQLVKQGTAMADSGRYIVSAAAFGATGTRIGIDRPLAAAPAATDDFLVWSKWAGRRGDALQNIPILGVASVGAITQGNYGWVQTQGICQTILAGGAIAAGDILQCSAVGRALKQAVVAAGDNAIKSPGYAISVAAANGDYFTGVLSLE